MDTGRSDDGDSLFAIQGHGDVFHARVTVASDVVRGAESVVSMAASGNATTEGIDTAATAAENGGDYVDFAHGTTRVSGQNILDKGLNHEDTLISEAYSHAPGSFFTVKVDPSDPRTALEVAADWAKRHEGDLCVVVCRLPRTVVNGLENAGSLVHTTIPYQSTFYPESFDAVNQNATWFWVDVQRGGA